MFSRWLWLVAGINGAGKTTLVGGARFSRLFEKFEFLNPDKLTDDILASRPGLDRGEANKLAADVTEAAVRSAVLSGAAGILVETVLASDKYKPYVMAAKERGIKVGLIYVALSSVDLAVLRVRLRVAAGGHDVPEDKIRSRWFRSLDNLAWFARHVDLLKVYNNDVPERAVLVAEGMQGQCRIVTHGCLPEIEKRLESLLAPDPPGG